MAKAQTASASPAVGGIRSDVPMPTRGKRGGHRSSGYPFDSLEVGQSFHIPKTEENPDPVSRISSSVSVARNKHAEVLTGADGQPIMVTKTTRAGKAEYPKKRVVRDFFAVAVGEDDPDGPGARVFRSA